MFDVRAGHRLGVFAVVSDHYGYGRIVLSHAVDEVLELVVAQEGFGGYGDKGTDVVFYQEGKRIE